MDRYLIDFLETVLRKILFIFIFWSVFLLNYMVFAEDTSSLFQVSPLLGRPTHSSITMNLVAGDEAVIYHLKYGEQGKSGVTSWKQTEDFRIDARSIGEIVLDSLRPGSLYEYRLFARSIGGKEFQLVTARSFRTQRKGQSPFSFAIVSDSHLTPFDRDIYRLEILGQVSASILSRKPEFLFMLGDNIQTFTSHGGPMTEERFGPILYMLLRKGLEDLPSSVPVFLANGNWEGENGWHPAREKEWARKARMAFFPNPGEKTYPEGGSKDEDYYGFVWGDVLCLVLNVTGYTPKGHVLNSRIGEKDDWTLGDRQRAWLFQQLSGSTARWKLLFIHHTVGGNAGDDMNTRYGRGGGRAASVGEQALIHKWMQQYGVQVLFYGHDHVFTDMTVDGIHYTCVGSAGAPWKFTREETGYERSWTPSGYTWVEVGEDSMHVSFIKPGKGAIEGEIMHTYTINKGVDSSVK